MFMTANFHAKINKYYYLLVLKQVVHGNFINVIGMSTVILLNSIKNTMQLHHEKACFKCFLPFLASAFVLHNIVLQLHEEAPVLPPNIREPAFQDQLQRAQILFLPRGRQDEENFRMRNTVIGNFF